MTTTHELIVHGAAVLVTVAESADGLFTAKVNGRPEVQAVATTRDGALRKIANRMQYATDLAA